MVNSSRKEKRGCLCLHEEGVKCDPNSNYSAMNERKTKMG